MVIGLALMLFALFVILIGTTPSEAKVLYYDLKNEKSDSSVVHEKPDGTVDGTEDMLPAIAEEQSTPARPRMKVTVGGEEIQQSTSVPSTQDKLVALKAAAKKNDPVRIQTATEEAQAIFDEIRQGKI